MKKIFNYALLAAALLIGVNVNAEEKQILLANLQAELNAANDGDILKISDVQTTLTLAARVNFYSGKQVTLNLNNHDIEAGTGVDRLIKIVRGDLTITGEGKMSNTNVGKGVIQICGNYMPLGENVVFSKLTIDEKVNLEGESRAIDVYSRPAAWITKEGVYVEGAANTYLESAKAPADAIEKFETTQFVTTNSAWGVAENVFVDMKGTAFGGEYAIQVSGVIQMPKAATAERGGKHIITEANEEAYLACVPYIHVFPMAKCGGSNSYNDNGKTKNGDGIYAAGYAKFLIEGECYGATGVYVKSGEVEVNNANIYSTWTQDVVATTGTKSGTVSAGNGIVVESNGSYSGEATVEISGNTTVTGGTGVGVEQIITNGTTDQLGAITISGGEISGDAGSITVDQSSTEKIEIEGGTVDGVKVGNETRPIEGFVPDGSHATVVTDDKGNTVIVITKGVGTAAQTYTQEQFNALASGANVNFAEGSPALNVSANKTLGEVVMSDNDITVKAGVKLTTTNIIMSKDANITVEPGARLIITGKDGFKNQSANNLVLKADQTNQAQFLLSPEATTNTHPKATVEYASGAYRDGSTVADFFGAPMNVVDTVFWTGAADYSVYFYVNDNGTDWTEIGNIIKGDYQVNAALFNRPFGFFEIAANNPSSAMQTYTFKGNIYGNTCPEVNFHYGWPGFSNAYMANVDQEVFWNYLDTQTADPTIYTWRVTGPTSLAWDAYNPLVEGGNLKPMSAFMLRNTNADKKLAMDYTAMVWDPIINPAPKAPRMSNIEKVSIRVADANGVYDKLTVAQDESFDANCKYNAEKFMNSELNLYVKAEKNLAIAAFDNLNNTFVGFNCKNAGKFTISFEGVTGSFALVDTKTNARINMVEGNTYEFLAEAGEDAYRFQIVAGAQAPTAIDNNAAAVKAAKALINGQIVINNGERFFNVLGADVK